MNDGSISKFLKTGPKLSSILAAELQFDQELSPQTARKRIERAKSSGEIASLDKLKFRRNEQFLYLPEHLGSELFRKNLLEALQHSRSSYRFPLQGIAARGGLVPCSIAKVFSGLPLQRKRLPYSEIVLDELASLGLLDETINSAGRCYRLSHSISNNVLSEERLLGRLAAESLVLSILDHWLKMQGLTAVQKASLRNTSNTPQFGFYGWDLVSPSFIQPLVSKRQDKLLNGFIVADVILGRRISTQDIDYFIQKAVSIKSNPKNRPFIPILMANWFEKDAFNLGRQHGFIFTTPRNFFGNNLALFLDVLVQELERRTPQIHLMNSLSTFSYTLANFQHLGPAFNEMAQFLGTMLLSHALQKLYPEAVTYRFDDCPTQLHSPKLDLILNRENFPTLVLTCSTEHVITVEIVHAWIDRIVSTYSALIETHYQHDTSLVAILIGVAQLAPAVSEYLAFRSKQHQNIKLEVADRALFLRLIQKAEHPILFDIFNRAFPDTLAPSGECSSAFSLFPLDE